MSNVLPTVFVVDPDASVRASLDILIRRSGWKPSAFACALDFLCCPPPSAPGCLLIDVAAPEANGLDPLNHIVAERKETPIIAMSDRADLPSIVHAMKAGAMEFLLKPLEGDTLIAAIAQALGKSQLILQRLAELQELRKRHDSLSGREREVMARVVAGCLNKQVASALGISIITVKAHRGRVMRKMEAGSLAELVRIAMKIGVPPPEPALVTLRPRGSAPRSTGGAAHGLPRRTPARSRVPPACH
jgi:FixJ family two-component response regulator